MRMLQAILLATDLRPASEELASVAVRIARAFGSRLTLQHVLEPIPSWLIGLYREREAIAKSLQDLTTRLQAEKIPVTPLLCVGSPTAAIVQKATDINADLIIIGAGVQTNSERFRAGPVAEAVLQQASTPVLAVRPGAAQQPYFQRVLCPVDQSPASARGLRNAIRLARAFESRLHVVSVVPEINWFTLAVETRSVSDPQAEHERLWREEFERFIESVDFNGVRWTKELRKGDPQREIVAAAREHDADIIVMGSTGRSSLSRMLLGSVTRAVLQDLPCSLLAVKDEDVLEQVFEEDRQVRLLMAEGRELLENDCYLPALLKFRQVTAINPFHAGALEGQEKAHEGLGQLDEAAICHRRVARLRHHDEVLV